MPIPSNPEQKVVCSAVLGILPILKKHFLLLVEICMIACWIEDKPIYEIERVTFLSFEKEEPSTEAEAK